MHPLVDLAVHYDVWDGDLAFVDAAYAQHKVKDPRKVMVVLDQFTPKSMKEQMRLPNGEKPTSSAVRRLDKCLDEAAALGAAAAEALAAEAATDALAPDPKGDASEEDSSADDEAMIAAAKAKSLIAHKRNSSAVLPDQNSSIKRRRQQTPRCTPPQPGEEKARKPGTGTPTTSTTGGDPIGQAPDSKLKKQLQHATNDRDKLKQESMKEKSRADRLAMELESEKQARAQDHHTRNLEAKVRDLQTVLRGVRRLAVAFARDFDAARTEIDSYIDESSALSNP